MLIFGIVHLFYEVPRDPPISAQMPCGDPYGNVSHQAVKIPTAVVSKFRFSQSSLLGVAQRHEHYLTCTPAVRVLTVLPNLCTKNVATVRRCKSESCIHPYYWCPKSSLRQSAPICFFTAIHFLGILHLRYEVLRDLPICVQRLCGHPYDNISQKTVQSLQRLYLMLFALL